MAEQMRNDHPPAVPRWVKVLAAIVLAVALALTVALLAGGGDHGPGRHALVAVSGPLAPSVGGSA